MPQAMAASTKDKSVRRNFLNISRSVTERAWIDRLPNDQMAHAIAQDHDFPEILGRVLAARHVAREDVAQYLEPNLRNLMPDPSTLQDMDAGVERISKAITSGEKIAVFGDYDVDGASASALLKRYFNLLGADLEIYIPDRLSEGYGPSEQAFNKLGEAGISLIITVDCGIASHDPILAVKQSGVDVVVVDHHMASPDLPQAEAVINPNRADDLSGLGALAATGVVFMLCVALNRHFRKQNHFSETKPEPDLMSLLDLVALATVCDVVPLKGLNRAFVAQGLKVMGQRNNIGLAALSDVVGLKRRPDTQALGFMLGPRINAGGRLGASDLGALLLCEHDRGRAEKLSTELNKLNQKRQLIEESILTPALIEAEQAMGKTGHLSVIVVAGDGWHAGVLGIIASRLKERFNRPTIAIGFDDKGQGTGSARSITGVDLGLAIRTATEQGLLVKGGGHAMAAGMTIERGKLGDFRAFMEQALSDQTTQAIANAGLSIDGALSAGAANLNLIELLERAGPYGAGNPKPRFAFPAHRITYADYVGTGHIRCTIVSGDGSRLKAIAFRAADGPLGDILINENHRPLHIAGTLARDDWGGRQSVQLFIDDAAEPVAGT